MNLDNFFLYCFLFFLGHLFSITNFAAELDTQQAQLDVQNNDSSNLLVISAYKFASPWSHQISAIDIIQQDNFSATQPQNQKNKLISTGSIFMTQSGSEDKPSSLSLRSMDSGQLLVLLDGIPINDSSNIDRGHDFSDLLAMDQDTIEILKGAQGGLYGSEAVAGVMSLYSEDPHENQTNVLLNLGSGQKKTVMLKNAIVQPQWWATFKIKMSQGKELSDASGGIEKDQHQKEFVQLKIHHDSESYPTTLSMHRMSARNDLDRGGGAQNDDPNYRVKNVWNFLSLQQEIKRFNNKWQQKIMLSDQWRDRKYQNEPDANDSTILHAKYASDRKYAQWLHELALNAENMLLLGLDWNQESLASDDATGTFPFHFNRKNQVQTGLFAQHLWTSIDETTFTQISARYDYLPNSKGALNYKLGAKQFLIPKTLFVRTSLATALKYPSLYQRYSEYGNPTLNEEKTHQWEIGWGTQSKHWDFNHNHFHSINYSMIDFDSITNKYINKNKVLITGDELAATYKNTSYHVVEKITLAQRQNLNSTDASLRKPHFLNSSTFSWDQDDWNFLVTGNYVSSRYDMDPVTFKTIKLSPYWLFNTSVQWQKLSWTFNLTFSNILNKKYEQIAGYSTMGRSIELQTVYTF